MALNRRILLQVTMPAVLISLALFAICLLGVRSINQLQANRAQILHQNVRSLQAAQELEIRLRQLRFHSFLYVMDPIPGRKEPIQKDQDDVWTLSPCRRRTGSNRKADVNKCKEHPGSDCEQEAFPDGIRRSHRQMEEHHS